MPGKMRSLLTNLVSSYDWGDTVPGRDSIRDTALWNVRCWRSEILPNHVHSWLSPVPARRSVQLKYWAHTQRSMLLYEALGKNDLSLSEVKGLPRMWSLPTQLDRGRLDSGILKCELERLSLGHSQPQLRILWGSSGAMLKTAPLQPITHVPFFQKWPHVLIIPKGSFFCTYWSFLVDRWQMIISRTVEVKGASTKRWGSWNSDQILHSTTSK